MRIIITESQLRTIVKEQPTGLAPAGGYDYQKPKAVAQGVQKGIDLLVNMDPHTRNQLLELGAGFIPMVGPFISAGIAAYDAKQYYNEGKTKEAGLAMVLGLLPGIASVANKIPAVKTLGQKGMTILAEKIANGVTKLTSVEAEAMQGINLNKMLIHNEADGVLKRVVTNLANKTAKRSTHQVVQNPLIHNAINYADKAAIQQGVSKGYETAYDALNK